MELMEAISDIKNKIVCALKREKDEYKKMSAAKKRVAIAEDVIAQIKCESYVPTAGVYVDIKESYKAREKGTFMSSILDQPADEMLQEGMLQCSVCAKGAMFMSHIRKDSETCSVNKAKLGGDESYIEDRLTDVFSEKQLDLIESAFEETGSYYANEHAPSSEKYNDDDGEHYVGAAGKAEKFGMRYSDDQKRLIGIMRNIIKNNGTFIPR